MNARLGEFTLKVPGGKLVRAEVRLGSGIESAKITGDFFLHPEETISQIEGCIRFCAATESELEISKRIGKALAITRAELHGVSTLDIARAIRGAIENAR